MTDTDRQPQSPQWERRVRSSVVAVLAYVLVTGVIEAKGRPFWYDEVFTAVLTRLPAMADVIGALEASVDTPPPGYYAVQRLLPIVPGYEDVGIRLASIVAVPLAAWFVFLTARPSSAGAAAVAAAIVILSRLNHGYSVEARPYAPSVCLVALGILAWTRAASPLWRAVLGLSLAAAVAVNYYSVWVLVPFGLAETVVTAAQRRLRRTVWAGIVFGALPLAVYWPVLKSLQSYYGGHYWSKPSLAEAMATYDYYFFVQFEGTAVGGCLLLGALLIPRIAGALRARSEPEQAIQAGTMTLSLALTGLPFLVWAGALIVGGGQTGRYSLAAVPGVALAVASVLSSTSRRQSAWALAALLLVFGTREVLFWRSGGATSGAQRVDVRGHVEMLAHATDSSLPIVVANGQDFLPIAYYAAGERDRLVSVTDLQASVELTGTDSVDRDLVALRPYWPIRVVDCEEFVAQNARFYLYSTPGPFNWATAHLRERFELEVVAVDRERVLYMATRTGDEQAGEVGRRHPIG